MPPTLDPRELARLTFHGAAGTVTGSCYRLETHRSTVLVECGMFQGGRDAEAKNAAPFDFETGSIDAVVLTHAHIDHSGRLPLLFRRGYRGDIHLSQASADLASILLEDSAHVQAMDARFMNRRRQRRGLEPVEPLYTLEEAERAIRSFVPRDFGERERLTEDIDIRFRPAGHILGAATVELWIRDGEEERRIVFSGDLGREEDPLLVPPDVPEPESSKPDLVLVETTYGDRDHKDAAGTLEELARILETAGPGNIVIPTFAVGRAQELIYYIGQLEREGRVHARPTFLDSPMAIDVTRLYQRNAGCCRDLVDADGPITTAQLAYTRTPEQSMSLNHREGITILSASGMCDGGRIQHHLKHNLWRPEAHVVFVGYQARGSLGRRIVDGASSVSFLGQRVAVRAGVHTLGGFSAHAGRSELIDWCRRVKGHETTFVLVHGEDRGRTGLAPAIQEQIGRPTLSPELGDAISIPRDGSGFTLRT